MSTVYPSGPINIEQGNTANFTLEFLSSSGELTVPSTTNMTIIYYDTSYSFTSESITLTENNSFFTGAWSSTSAALGLASWSVTMTGSTEVQAAGQIRVLQRQSTY